MSGPRLYKNQKVKVYSSGLTPKPAEPPDYLDKSLRELLNLAQLNYKQHYANFNKIKKTVSTAVDVISHEIEIQGGTTFQIDGKVYDYKQSDLDTTNEPDKFILTNEEKQATITLNKKDFDILAMIEMIRREHNLNLFQKIKSETKSNLVHEAKYTKPK